MEERPPQPLRQEQLPLERSFRRRGGDETRYPRQGVTSDSPSPSSNRRCIIDSRRHQLRCVNTGSKSLFVDANGTVAVGFPPWIGIFGFGMLNGRQQFMDNCPTSAPGPGYRPSRVYQRQSPHCPRSNRIRHLRRPNPSHPLCLPIRLTLGNQGASQRCLPAHMLLATCLTKSCHFHWHGHPELA